MVFSLGAVVGCMMLFAGNTALAAAPIKIGVMFPLTGPLAIAGEMMVDSAKFAFDQVGYQIAGKKIEIIVEDSGGQPAMSVDKARKLVERDKVDMVIGPLIGSTVIATASYMSKAGKPHLTTSPSPPPVFKQKWSFITCGSEPQHTSCIGGYAYDKLGHRTITVMTGDTVQGHGFLGAFMGAFKSKGGKVVQEQYAPYPCNDYAPYLTALKDADALVAWFDGSDAIRFLTQVHEYGIRKRMSLVGAFHGSFFAPYILNKMSPAAADAVIGEYCVTAYTDLLDNEVNKKFVADFTKKFKRPPFEADAGPYEAALVAIGALKAAGGDTSPAKLRKAILGLKMDTPGGPLKFDPKMRCRIRDIYIFKVDKHKGHYVWVPVYTYKDVPSFGFGPPPGPPKGH
ncbi:MAG: ABC transporter substrate-binding protein [Deltaproteobacteria bacterium]|nr:ABC transporter substrate-binding protein [Deltaproteobacteria bacterium]